MTVDYSMLIANILRRFHPNNSDIVFNKATYDMMIIAFANELRDNIPEFDARGFLHAANLNPDIYQLLVKANLT